MGGDVVAPVQELSKSGRPKIWGCTSECKQLTKEEYDIILDTKGKFSDDSVQNVRNMLLCIDECPHRKYPKVNVGTHEDMHVEKMGHSMLCTDGSCKSPLRLLKQASTHHTQLSPLVRLMYVARSASAFIRNADTAMSKGDIGQLMKLGQCEKVFDKAFEADTVTVTTSLPRMLHDENQIQKKHMVVINNYQSKANDDPEFACLCCERLCTKQYCTGPFSLTKQRYNTPVYQELKDYIRKRDPNADQKLYYVCRYCQCRLLKNEMPYRCVLNGLETEPIPKELSNLSPFGKQMIQKVKPFQTIIRLGTYMGKVPKYNTLKACKGTMFCLPLPLDNTKGLLDEAISSLNLPEPEVYIVVNGKPTKNKTIWQELINVKNIKNALGKLNEINWLYKNVDKDSIDEAMKKIEESTSNINNRMLRKATKVDIDAFQATVLQNMRGTKQCWNLKRGDLNCICREYGPSTLFMTFSCAEYDSEDMERYLRKVNNVSPGYSHSKLCVEDPISVSRKYSQQFHTLFNEVLIKGQVLGEITHYFWKKEYQARGAPHYHMVVWIRDVPVVGIDDPAVVTKFIDERITCKLPCEKSNPILHKLVTKYNTHVCNKYCRWPRKVNGTYIIRCRFLYPLPVSNVTQVLNVEECLKSRKTMYNLARTSDEVRINAYNPLLMLLW